MKDKSNTSRPVEGAEARGFTSCAHVHFDERVYWSDVAALPMFLAAVMRRGSPLPLGLLVPCPTASVHWPSFSAVFQCLACRFSRDWVWWGRSSSFASWFSAHLPRVVPQILRPIPSTKSHASSLCYIRCQHRSVRSYGCCKTSHVVKEHCLKFHMSLSDLSITASVAFRLDS